MGLRPEGVLGFLLRYIDNTMQNVGSPEIIDALTSTDATKALSANQGKLLNDKVTTAQTTANTANTTANSKASYEEGTFSLKYIADKTFTMSTFKYIKLGKLVIVYGDARVDSAFSGTNLKLQGLPFPAYANGAGGLSYFYFGSNTGYVPSNIASNGKSIAVEGSSLKVNGDMTYNVGQPFMLFGIYLTS